MGPVIKSAIILILAAGAKLITSRETGCASLLKSQGSRKLRIENVCKAQGDSCIEACECCGNDKGLVRCEKRNKSLGYRCYKSVGIGGECDQDHDCRSQKCHKKKQGHKGRCVSYFTHVMRTVPVPTCSLTENYIAVTPIKGTIQDNLCQCDEHDEPSDPTVDDAAMALDGDSSTIYINNWAINGGIQVQLKRKEGLHSFKVCNSDDCINCDPTYYRIEGYCQFTHTYKAVQEGPLSLPDTRNQCVTVPIGGKPLYSSYRITFPHQRGTCTETCTGECSARPVADPKHGPCDRYRDDGIKNVGSMKFISKEFEADTTRTIFYYSVDSIDLEYAMLSWEGQCKVDHYDVYHEVNGEMELETHGCGNDFVLGGSNEIHSLCMQGLQIYSDFRKPPGNKYMIKVYMIGNIEETTMLPYGMYGKVGTKFQAEYGEVISPKCPADLCKVTCPLKLSEISLYTQECASSIFYDTAGINVLPYPTSNPTSSPTLAPTTASPTTFADRYIGCYEDKKGSPRDLPYQQPDSNTNKCLQRCKQKGYKYMGRQRSNKCFCGNTYGSYGETSRCTNCMSENGNYGAHNNCIFSV